MQDDAPTPVLVYWSYVLHGLDRDEVEDALDRALGSDGQVVGAESGSSGSNLDLEISGDPERALTRVTAVLKELGMPADTYLVMHGRRHHLR